ncbi:MAG: hypothetical protein KIT62_01285 [Cyclobacteriaceae bacterium]|nr:hypothetical protein [Cyclobacteriaceae bacterium]
MKTEKMSFRNIKDVLSRDEMKSIMAGSGGGGTCGVRIGNQSWCGMTMWEAQTIAAQNGGWWCCDSCASNGGNASYC